MKNKIMKRVLPILCIVFVLSSVLYDDYTICRATSVVLPWDASLPFFGESLRDLILGSNGFSLDAPSIEEIYIFQQREYKERCNMAHEAAQKAYPKEVFCGKEFGWSETQYDMWIRGMERFYIERGYIPTDGGKTSADFWNEICFNLEHCREVQEMKEKGKSLALSFRDFCYQSQVTVLKRVVSGIANVLNPNGTTVEQVSSITGEGVDLIAQSSLFEQLDMLYRLGYRDRLEASLMGVNNAYRRQVCDYSAEFWASGESPKLGEQAVIAIRNMLVDGVDTYFLSFNNKRTNASIWGTLINGGHKIYPLTFQIDGVPQIGISSTYDGDRLSCTNCMNSSFVRPNYSSGYTSTFVLGEKTYPYGPILFPNLGAHSSQDVSASLGDIFNENVYNDYCRYYTSRKILDPAAVEVWDEHVIDVGTLENYKKWYDTVRGGEYTFVELLNLMERGWVANPSKKRAVTVKGSSVAKDAIAKNPGKYREKEDEDKVTPGSLARGIQKSDAIYGDVIDVAGETEWADVIDRVYGEAENERDKAYGAAISGKLDGFAKDKDAEYDQAAYDQAAADRAKDAAEKEKPPSNPGNVPIIPGFGVDGSDNVAWYERFPFCIPYDICRFAEWFQTKKKAPSWKLHFVIKRLKIDESFTINFSDFQVCIKVVRVFIILSYSYGLILISRNVIRG